MASKSKRPRYSTHKRIAVPEVTGWLRDVECGRVPACEDMRMLCAHVRRVFATERLWVDRERLARYMGYQRHFPFDLSNDEKFLVALWLCTFREGGFPRWRDLLLYVGRGYGKTGFGAFLAFCMISPANGIENYDVDVCATTEPQARIGYNDLWRMFEKRSDYFSQGFDWNKVELHNIQTGSRFKYWSGNSDSKDGMQSGCVWFDEVHAYEDNASMEVFTGGLGKKDHPRRLMTTTDGEVRDGPLDEMLQRSRAILRGERPDMGLLPFLCHLDSIQEADDESAWPKACPRLLRSPTLMEEYRTEVAEWRDNPQRHPMVPTKRFNLSQGRTDVQVTSWDNLVAASRDFDASALAGRPCVVGIDYARTTDMVGAVALFRVDGEWQVIHHAWWCERSRDAGEVKAPLREWKAAGELTFVDDVEIPPSLVGRWVSEMAARFDVRMVAVDYYRLTLMRDALAEAGFDSSLKGDEKCVWLTRPSDVMRIQPVIDSAFATHSIAWSDSPLMRWATNNAKLVPAPHDNWTYGKIEPHGRKTDPFMALVHAFCVSGQIPEDAGPMVVPMPMPL